MTLVDHIADLRALVVIDPQATMLEVALVNAFEELAEEVDKLNDQPPPEPRGFGSV
jgi:hypothetical protein